MIAKHKNTTLNESTNKFSVYFTVFQQCHSSQVSDSSPCDKCIESCKNNIQKNDISVFRLINPEKKSRINIRYKTRARKSQREQKIEVSKQHFIIMCLVEIQFVKFQHRYRICFRYKHSTHHSAHFVVFHIQY